MRSNQVYHCSHDRHHALSVEATWKNVKLRKMPNVTLERGIMELVVVIGQSCPRPRDPMDCNTLNICRWDSQAECWNACLLLLYSMA